LIYLSADTKSIEQTHTFFITQVDKHRKIRTFYNGIGADESQGYRHCCNCVEGRTTGLQAHS